MSTHIIGFKAPDDKWREMKAVWNACRAAGVEPPEAVSKYFEWDTPDDTGVEVRMEGTECCVKWDSDSRSGFEVDLRKLPADLPHIRFYNSY